VQSADIGHSSSQGESLAVFHTHDMIANRKPMMAAAVQTVPLARCTKMAIATGTTAEPMMLPMAW
jgi:hypothetical protein